ncbi:MRPS28 family protein [Megaselia abdita]
MSMLNRISTQIVRNTLRTTRASAVNSHRFLCTQITTPLETKTKQESQNEETFASLLRNSKFVDLGDPEGKIVVGKIFHTVEDDLYVDFGWKFHCVVSRPFKNGEDYVRGAKVRLRIKDLELSTRFLGSDKDLTLLEADCQLLSLVSSPRRNVTRRQQQATSS